MAIDMTNPDARAEVPTLRLVNGERVTLTGHCYAWHGKRRSYTILAPFMHSGDHSSGVHIVITYESGQLQRVGEFFGMPDAVAAAQWDDTHR